MEKNDFFEMKGIDKDYIMGDEPVHALKNVSLSIREGEYLSILGPSGSGKSTLMNIIGCLDTPTRGQYILRGRDVGELEEAELARLRNRGNEQQGTPAEEPSGQNADEAGENGGDAE